MIIPKCGCLPSFVEYNQNKIDICTGEKLYCSLDWMKFMGSSKDPDLTVVQTLDNKTQRCLQRCDIQSETIMTTTSNFPNRETFLYRQEFCYVLQKIARICSNPIQKLVFEQKVTMKDCCKQILELNNTLKVCDEFDRANVTLAYSKPEIIDFLFDYASKNLAILNLFIRDPYYTKYLKSEQISVISFIGNAGGLLGLCMGMSFVSIFELFYHCFNTIFISCDRGCRTKKRMIEVKE